MRPAAFVRMLAIAVALLVPGLAPGMTGAQEAAAPETVLERWALEGLMVKALGLLPDGDVLAGTRKGLWRVDPDEKSAVPFPSAGLPPGCANPVELDDCLVTQIEISSDGDVYALIGSREFMANNGGYLAGNAGLYRERAGSGSWELLIAPDNAAVRVGEESVPSRYLGRFALGLDGTLYVVARGQHAYNPEDIDCIYRSAEGGESWSLSVCGSKPGMPEIDFVGAGPDGRAWLSGGGFYYFPWRWPMTSPDGGAQWEVRKIDPKDTAGHYFIVDMAFDREGRTYVTTALAARGTEATEPQGVFRTADAGVTWERLTPDDIPMALNVIGFADNGDLLYGNGGTVWRTSDDGQTWTQVAPSTDLPLNAMQVGADGHLWLGDDSWLYRTADAVTSGPLVVPPKPGVAPGPGVVTPVPGQAVTPVSDDSGIDEARQACTASGGTFSVYPNGGYECIHGPGGATGTAAPEPPVATAVPASETPIPAATTAPPDATATAISQQPATSVPATVPPTAPAPTAPAPGATARPPATSAPAATTESAATATPAATAAPPVATAATTPAGNPRDEARRKCFESGGEFWERPNGDFGCRRPGTVGPTIEGPGTTGATSGATIGGVNGADSGQQPADEPRCAPCPPGTTGAPVIFSLGSFASRVNGPIAPTQFTLDGEYVIERIQTWHIQGSPMSGSGTIALRGDDGTLHGPWPAKAPTDRGRNTVWEATPNVTLGPGVYTIIDSDPDTWSQNADTDGRGMAAVYGRPAGTP